MKRSIIFLIISVLALGLSVYLIFVIAPQFIEEIGTRDEVEKIPLATDFTLTGLDGKANRLSEARGKNVVLIFWTSWNGVSLEELQTLGDYYDRYAPENLEIIAINSQESLSVVEEIQARYKLAFKMLLDSEGEVGELYNIGVLPQIIFIDKFGFEKKVVTGALTLKEIEEGIAELDK